MTTLTAYAGTTDAIMTPQCEQIRIFNQKFMQLALASQQSDSVYAVHADDALQFHGIPPTSRVVFTPILDDSSTLGCPLHRAKQMLTVDYLHYAKNLIRFNAIGVSWRLALPSDIIAELRRPTVDLTALAERCELHAVVGVDDTAEAFLRLATFQA